MNKYREERIHDYLNDILESIIYAQNFIINKTKEEFVSDEMAIFAIKRCIENISRAALNIRRIEGDKRYDQLPWREIIGMNRKINHAYQEIPASVVWQTVEEEFGNLEAKVRSALGDLISPDIPEHSNKLNRKKLEFSESVSEPELWLEEVAPYVTAMSYLQKIIGIIRGTAFKPIEIKSVSRNSPISLSLDGVADTTDVVLDMVVQWRREHEKEMARLEELEKTNQVEIIKAEALEIRARAGKQRAEAKRIDYETKVEIERKQLENEKIRLEIEQLKINLALSVLDKISADLTTSQRVLYVAEVLKPLNILIESPLLLIETIK